jgi:pyrroline-5-carboxylate reductase
MKNILLIGAGNMGSAIGKALLSKNFVRPKSFFVTDTHQENLEFFTEKNCNTENDAKKFLPNADIIILATKPQVLRELLDKWKNFFKKDAILVSIAAGVSCGDLEKFSGLERSIRVMPNTPLLVEKGTSGYFFSGSFEEEEKEKISTMMQCFGLAIECESEEKINAITALSGSGPAYFFRLLELMAEQGENFGFTKTESEKIALQTLQGAGLLAEKSEDDFQTLRKKVTSKGGTTEAALNFFEENNLGEVWKGGMVAAKERAEEL